MTRKYAWLYIVVASLLLAMGVVTTIASDRLPWIAIVCIVTMYGLGIWGLRKTKRP